MQIICVPTGVLEENTYIGYEPGTGTAILVDPGDNAPDVLGLLREHNLTPSLILLTHAHFDHVGAIAAVQAQFGTPVAVHRNDRGLLEGNVPEIGAVQFVDGQDILQGGELDIQVIHTPGHSAGSVCYLVNGVLFSGDTLFKGSVGRTDFPESNPRDMARSLEILRQLPETTMVYPGHGAPTTIGEERRTNPWMR